jgi:O-antigen/teichoic acid export membrane protein
MAGKSKFLQRLLMISNGVVFQLINAFSTAIIAYYVMANKNTVIWGKFAGIWVLISLFTMVFNFGSKDYLLKEYSKSKMLAFDVTRTNLVLRFPLLLVCIIISCFLFPLDQLFLIIIILLASFVVNSFHPILIYEKRFNFLLSVELIAILTQLIFLFASYKLLQLNYLIISFLIYYLIKGFSLFFIYGAALIPSSIQINFSELKPLLPFFLLALGGMLVNKADFIIVTALLDDISKAHYQVISTFSTMGIIAAHALLQPFMKEIYRINWDSFKSIAKQYFMVGIVLSLCYTLLVYFAISVFFEFNLSINSLVLLYAIELIFFATNPMIFFLFRNDKQHQLVTIVIVAGTFTLLCAWLFVKPFGINGALLANLIGNCLILIFLWVLKSKILKQLMSATAD